MEPRLRLNRREFLRLSAGLIGMAVVAGACTPKPTDTGKTATSVPAATQAPAKSEAKVPLRVGAWEDATRSFMRDAPVEYGKQHPEVDVAVEVVVYAESFSKCLTGAATGTLPDVLYAPIRWAPYAAYKGAFKYLDELIQTKDPGKAEWFDSVVEGAKFEDKMYALPFELHPGRPTVVYYNKDLLAQKGVSEPTDSWTMDQYAEIASKLTDKSKRIFGSSFFPNNVHDFCAMARSMGGDGMSEDRKTFLFNSDPGAQKAARWQVDLKTKYDAVPGRQDLQGLTFYAGLYGFYPDSPNVVQTVKASVGDKFKWDAVLAPTGPSGLLGAWAFINSFVLSAKTAHASEAYDLALYMTSEDVMKRALLEQGHNPARKSLWLLPTAHPIWKRAYDWFSSSKAKQFFPIPWNLLFEELADKFLNLAPALWYGEVAFEDGMKQVQDECQKIMDKPRP